MRPAARSAPGTVSVPQKTLRSHRVHKVCITDLWLAIGVFAYRLTQSSVQGGVNSVTRNRGLMRSIRFPRALPPISRVISGDGCRHFESFNQRCAENWRCGPARPAATPGT